MKLRSILAILTIFGTFTGFCQEPTKQQLLKSFAFVESSNRSQIWGDNGKAWGKYQFHIERWMELGGKKSEFGKATESRQDEIMLIELNLAIHKSRKMGVDIIRGCATYHNNGNIKDLETNYVRKIRKNL